MSEFSYTGGADSCDGPQKGIVAPGLVEAGETTNEYGGEDLPLQPDGHPLLNKDEALLKEDQSLKNPREGRQIRRQLLVEIEWCHSILKTFTTRDQVLEFENSRIKKLEWEVYSFTAQARERGEFTNLGEKFENLVVASKEYWQKLSSTSTGECGKPPDVQLGSPPLGSGKDSKSRLTTISSRSVARIELETQLAELQLAKEQAQAEQALANIKFRKKELHLRAAIQKEKVLSKSGSTSSSGTKTMGTGMSSRMMFSRKVPAPRVENGSLPLFGSTLGDKRHKVVNDDECVIENNVNEMKNDCSCVTDDQQCVRKQKPSRCQNNQSECRCTADFRVPKQRKDFQKQAQLLCYDGYNRPFIVFKNEMRALWDSCPFPDLKLTLIRSACTGAASQAISLAATDNPSYGQEQRAELALEQLALRFAVRGGFNSESIVREVRYGPRLKGTESSDWRGFRTQLLDCQILAAAYERRDLLEGHFVEDLAKRLPLYVRNHFVEYLNSNYGSTADPSFESLLKFVNMEENKKSTDFVVKLMSENNKKSVIAHVGQRPANRTGSCHMRSTVVKRNCDVRNSNSSVCCEYCLTLNEKSSHDIVNCRRLIALPEKDRLEFVKNNGLCFNCGGRHRSAECKQSMNCDKCESAAGANRFKHMSALHGIMVFKSSVRHGEKLNARSNVVESDSSNVLTAAENLNKSDVNVKFRNASVFPTKVLSRVVAARVINPENNMSKLVYCQMDYGSEITLIKESLCKHLGLQPYRDVTFTMGTLLGTKKVKSGVVKFEIQSLFDDSRYCVDDVVSSDMWSDGKESLPHNRDLSMYRHFDNIRIVKLPDCCGVDLIIGDDCSYLLTVLSELVGAERWQPHAICTPLGWLSGGGASPLSLDVDSATGAKVGCVLTSSAEQKSELENLRSELWSRDSKIAELEQLLKESRLDEHVRCWSREDKKAFQLVKQGSKIVDERFEIPIPIHRNAVLPDNESLAMNRLEHLRNKSLNNEALRDFLIESFKDLREKEYIEIAPINKTMGQTWFLPFFVTSQSKRRIVYDGKALYENFCINDYVMSGPDLLNNLCDVLLRFRRGKYGYMSDIKKCFFQVRVPEEQRDLLRVLWFENDDVNGGKVVQYRFTRHAWGLKSSPFIANFAIRETLNENLVGASKETVNLIRDNIYMDDLLFSVDELSDAEKIVTEANSLFSSRGFQLVKWSANKESLPVLSKLDVDCLALGLRNLDLSDNVDDEIPGTKALGCVWDLATDCLKIKSDLTELEFYTRRKMLSQLAKTFDPLGLYCCFFVKARLILQELAISKFDWDSPVPLSVAKKWKEWFDMLSELLNVSVSRYYFRNAGVVKTSDQVVHQVHCFVDASEKAYGSVVYLRRLVSGVASVSLVLGKSRIVLQNQQSWGVPRKELVAAVMGVEIMSQVVKALNMESCNKFFWTDSKTVLQWIKNDDLRLEKFVARRIAKILLFSSSDQWRYCHTTVNPADVASRADAVKKREKRDLWFNGPAFLHQSHEIPLVKVCRSGVVVTSASSLESEMPVNFVVENENLCPSKEGVLERVVASAPSLYIAKKRIGYLAAFVEFIYCKAKGREFRKPAIDQDYLNRALDCVIGCVQKRLYGAAIRLMSGRSTEALLEALKKLKNHSHESWFKDLKSLARFRPCLDEQGILRIGGRLDEAPELTRDEKHPVIIPTRHPLTRLIVLNFHATNGHVGVQHTLLYTRKKFWIVKGTWAVKQYLRDCGSCAIERAKPIRPLMADLPVVRTTTSVKAFETTGMDYLGPVEFVQGRSVKKAWGLLFTCLTSRAVHVELVTSLSLSDFLLAFSRFTDSRGPVKRLYSDNGSTFVCAEKVLTELLASVDFGNALRERGVLFSRIPVYAPSQGGAWESMVKQFKIVLTRTLKGLIHLPNFVELLTFFSRATRILNERPLTTVSDDPDDFRVVTPASLLTPSYGVYVPLGQANDKDIFRRNYHFLRGLSQRFWENWREIYLPTLQGRGKWRIQKPNLKDGDLVLVWDLKDRPIRGDYRVGRVVETFPQRRNGREYVRRVKVAVVRKNTWGDDFHVENIVRDVSCVAPVEGSSL